jgi:hypothetical protein
MIAMDLFRAALLAALVVAIALGGGLYVLYPAALLIGAGTFAFNAASFSLVRHIVADDELNAANGQMEAAESVAQHLVGPPVGGLVFAVARTLPFIGDSLSFLASSLLLRRVPDVRTETSARLAKRFRPPVLLGQRPCSARSQTSVRLWPTVPPRSCFSGSRLTASVSLSAT